MNTVFIAKWTWTDGYEHYDGILGVYSEKRFADLRVEDYLKEVGVGSEEGDAHVEAHVLWESYGDLK